MKTVTAFETRVRGPSRPDNVILNAAVFKFDWSISPETGVESSLDFEHRSTALLALYLLSVVQKTTFQGAQETYPSYHHIIQGGVLNSNRILRSEFNQ